MSTPSSGWSLPLARPRDSAAPDDGDAAQPGAPPTSGFLLGLGASWGLVPPVWSALQRLAGVSRRLRVLVLTLAHILAFTAIYRLAYVVRFDGTGRVPPEYWELARATLPLVVGVKMLAFFLTGSHRGWWRYATFADMTLLAETTTLGSMALVLINSGVPTVFHIPRSVLLFDWAVTIL
ncbi:MAG TPA: hypothetical protein VF590_11155, partial [Isosphaeraceae bacterium]